MLPLIQDESVDLVHGSDMEAEVAAHDFDLARQGDGQDRSAVGQMSEEAIPVTSQRDGMPHRIDDTWFLVLQQDGLQSHPSGVESQPLAEDPGRPVWLAARDE